MDPLSLIVGAMAGAAVTAIVMGLVKVGDDEDDLPPLSDEIDDASLYDGGLILPDSRKLH